MDRAELPVIYLARHGETAWSLTGQHTGLTDLLLTEVGEGNVRRLRDALTGLTFAKVFSSPLRRAGRTCELAGFGSRAEVVRDLVEWDYGDYEGQRQTRKVTAISRIIPRRLPGWRITATSSRARRPRRGSGALSFRERSDLFQRTFPANVSRTLDRH